jgi:hypothetical protein
VFDVVTAIYKGDFHSVDFVPIADNAKAEPSALEDSGVSSQPAIHIDEGDLGLQPSEAIFPEGHEGHTVNDDYSQWLMQDSGENARLGDEEVLGFLDAFTQWYGDKSGMRPNTVEALDFITDRVKDGTSRAEIREEALSRNSPLAGRNGELSNAESWKAVMQGWARR